MCPCAPFSALTVPSQYPGPLLGYPAALERHLRRGEQPFHRQPQVAAGVGESAGDRYRRQRREHRREQLLWSHRERRGGDDLFDCTCKLQDSYSGYCMGVLHRVVHGVLPEATAAALVGMPHAPQSLDIRPHTMSAQRAGRCHRPVQM